MLRKAQILFLPLVYLVLMANSCGMKRGANEMNDIQSSIRVIKASQQTHYPGVHSNLQSVINADIEIELLRDMEVLSVTVLMDSVMIQPESIKLSDKFQPYEKFPSEKGVYVIHLSRNTYQEAPKNMHEEVIYQKSGRNLSKKYVILFKTDAGEFEIETVPEILESLRHP